MTLEEKIQAMESIWDDLCRNQQNLSPPNWHGDILSDREEAEMKGLDQFEDWETAKKKIRNKTS